MFSKLSEVCFLPRIKILLIIKTRPLYSICLINFLMKELNNTKMNIRMLFKLYLIEFLYLFIDFDLIFIIAGISFLQLNDKPIHKLDSDFHKTLKHVENSVNKSLIFNNKKSQILKIKILKSNNINADKFNFKNKSNYKTFK